MRHQALPLVVVLSAMLGFARAASDNEAARAIKGAHLLHGSMQNPDSLQVSRALITGGNVCIDYRGRSGSGATNAGVAVYESDKNLLFVDNSWIWQRDCLFGKYAQRREGADVTEVVTTALRKQTTRPLNGNERPVVQVPSVVKITSSAPSTPPAAVTPTETGTTITAQPGATAPAELRSPVVKAPDATEVAARVAPAPVGQPLVPVQRVETAAARSSDARAAIASAPVVTASALPQQAAAAPVETHIAGMLIIGTSGPVPGTPSSVATESLGDAARRLKKEKTQRLQDGPRRPN